jgi:hypothetical protein
MEFRRHQGSLLLFAGGMTIRTSDFPLKGLFSPLLNRSVRYLASRGREGRRNYIVGMPLEFTVSREAQRFEIMRPDGEVARPSVEIKGGKFTIVYRHTDIPGIYTLRINGQRYASFAVNCDPRESDLNPVSTAQLEQYLPSVRVLQRDQEAALAAIRESRFGSELAIYFFLLALLCLAAEMWIARYRKQNEPLETPEKIIISQGVE